MTRVYVAGASAERDRVVAAMELVRELGGTVAHDWLALIDAAGSASLGRTREQRQTAARGDAAAIRSADVLWLLAPQAVSRDAWVELGIALALRESQQDAATVVGAAQRVLRIVVSGPAHARSVFSALADHEVPGDVLGARLAVRGGL